MSVGGALCVVGCSLPLLLLRSQKVILVPEKELNSYGPAARDALRLQQHQMTWLLKMWPYVSISFIILGIALSLVGAVIWKHRQDVVNEKEREEIEKIRADRAKIHQEVLVLLRQGQVSTEEAIEGIERRIFEEEADSEPDRLLSTDILTVIRGDDSSPVGATGDDVPPPGPIIQGMQRYIRAEQEVLDALRAVYGGKMDAVRDVRVGRSRVDLVVTSRLSDRPNLLVEVHAVGSKNIRNISKVLEKSFQWTFEVRGEAYHELGGIFHPAIIVILDPEIVGPVQSNVGRVVAALDRATRRMGDIFGEELVSSTTMVTATQGLLSTVGLHEVFTHRNIGRSVRAIATSSEFDLGGILSVDRESR